jgi:hypothetical protein
MRRNHVAVGTLAFLREPLDERRCVGDLAATFEQRLALLDRHQHREIFLVRHHQVEPLAQDLGAFLGGARSPLGQRLVGRFDRAPRLGRAEIRDRADAPPGGRIEDLFRLPVGSAIPAPADEGLLAKQRHVTQRNRRLRNSSHGKLRLSRPADPGPGRASR